MSTNLKLTEKEMSLLGDFEFGVDATVVKVGDDTFGVDTPDAVVDVLISMLGADFAENLVEAGILCEVTHGCETDQYAVTGKADGLVIA